MGAMLFMVLEKIIRRNHKEIEHLVRILPDVVESALIREIFSSCGKSIAKWWGQQKPVKDQPKVAILVNAAVAITGSCQMRAANAGSLTVILSLGSSRSKPSHQAHRLNLSRLKPESGS